MDKKKGKNINNRVEKLLAAVARRHLANNSKGEQILLLTVSILAAACFILNIINSIAARSVWGIVSSLTIGTAVFVLTVLLSVSDSQLLWRGRSMILVAYSGLMLIDASLGLINPPASLTILGILGLLAAFAAYGTLIFDQFVSNDSRAKFWLIYGGVAYKLLFAIVMMIIDSIGTGALGVASALVRGLSSIATLVLLLYLFDGFSFAKYLYSEIIDYSTEEDISGDISEEDEEARHKEVDISDGAENMTGFTNATQTSVSDNYEDNITENEAYLPYSDQIHAHAEDNADKEPSEEEKDAENVMLSDILAKIVEAEVADDDSKDETELQAEVEDTDQSAIAVTQPDATENCVPYKTDHADNETDDGRISDADNTIADVADNSPETENAFEETVAEETGIEESVIEKSAADESPEETPDAEESAIAESSSEEHAVEAADDGKSQTDDKSEEVIPAEISPVLLKYARFAAAHHKPDNTLQVTGMSGDLFDVWVDSENETICFLNDLTQASEGRGVRSAVIAFSEVEGLSQECLADGCECVVLSYKKDGQAREIRFTKDSFPNFKRVLEQAAGE